MGEPTEAVAAESGREEARPASSAGRRKRRKTIIVFAIIAVALLIVIWGWGSTGKEFMDVSTLVDSASSDPLAYVNNTYEIQGIVTAWSGPADLDFVLVDRIDVNKSIEVTMEGAYPEGFENNKGVVVKGTLMSVSPPHLIGTEITIGCASKY